MPKLKINEIPDEERLIFLKRIKTKELEGDFDLHYDEAKSIAINKGYKDNELKFLKEVGFTSIYVVIKLKY
jgi:hypothetical protein